MPKPHMIGLVCGQIPAIIGEVTQRETTPLRHFVEKVAREPSVVW